MPAPSPAGRAYRELALIAFLLALIAAAVSLSGVLARLDHLVFDAGQRLSRTANPDDLVIVAIDKDSLDRLGRWPWPRETHARLLQRVCADRPAAVGLDLAFSEASQRTVADQTLADAIAACGRVVLPLVIETASNTGQLLETPPIPPILNASGGLGRVGVRLDEDGIARTIDLQEGIGRAAWPLFAAELLRVARLDINAPPSVRSTEESQTSGGEGLVRENPRRIPFSGPPGHLPRLSFAQVLDGAVPAGFFAGKTVLVGVTAVGLGDFLPTPVSAQSHPMPGVEVQANIWLALRHDRLITSPANWQPAVFGTLAALIPLLWLPRLTPLAGLAATLLWMLSVGAVAASLPHLLGHWLPPSGALIAIFSANPLWSWRRLEEARRHLDQQLQQLGESAADAPPQRLNFTQRIARIQAAQQRLRQLEAQRQETLAFISHDLRSPLAGVVQQLESDPGTPVEQLLPPLRRAQAMAQDFLRLAQAEALDERSMRPLDFGSIVHQAIDEIYLQTTRHQQTLQRHLPDDPVWVLGNFQTLERLVINLLQNATKYAPDGSSIDVGITLTPPELEFWVENDGKEIDAATRARLFARHARGTSTADSQRPGLESTGLGLYFVQTVAHKHGGRADMKYIKKNETGKEGENGKIRVEVTLPIDPSAHAGNAAAC